MNVFILDRYMEKSAQMLDDSHLKAQINEACQILMANWNHKHYPTAKIGHLNHPVTKFYKCEDCMSELANYCYSLVFEYLIRFGKRHQNEFFIDGYAEYEYQHNRLYFCNTFVKSKTYVNGTMTDNIEKIRNYIMTKPMKKKPTWTNRKKPDWWVV